MYLDNFYSPIEFQGHSSKVKVFFHKWTKVRLIVFIEHGKKLQFITLFSAQLVDCLIRWRHIGD